MRKILTQETSLIGVGAKPMEVFTLMQSMSKALEGHLGQRLSLCSTAELCGRPWTKPKRVQMASQQNPEGGIQVGNPQFPHCRVNVWTHQHKHQPPPQTVYR